MELVTSVITAVAFLVSSFPKHVLCPSFFLLNVALVGIFKIAKELLALLLFAFMF